MYDRYKTRVPPSMFSGLHWPFPLGLFLSTFFRFISLVPIFSAYLRCTIKNRKKNHRQNWKKKGGRGEGERPGLDGTVHLPGADLRSYQISFNWTVCHLQNVALARLPFTSALGGSALHGLGLGELTSLLNRALSAAPFLIWRVLVLCEINKQTWISGRFRKISAIFD